MTITDTSGIDRWALDYAAEELPTGWYDGMADPLYAWESTGSIVLYDDRGHDTISMARIAAGYAEQRPNGDENDDDADYYAFTAFAEAWEPVAEALAEAAEDANLETGGDRLAIVEHLATVARDILGDGWTVETGALFGTRSGRRVYARADR